MYSHLRKYRVLLAFFSLGLFAFKGAMLIFHPVSPVSYTQLADTNPEDDSEQQEPQKGRPTGFETNEDPLFEHPHSLQELSLAAGNSMFGDHRAGPLPSICLLVSTPPPDMQSFPS